MRRYVNKAGKNLLLFVVLFCALFSVSAQQNEPWLWPICGQKTGEGIISKPQQYIDKELNFNDLFIEAKEGAPVILTEKGERVRSKSEKILADYFYRNNILYKYEKPLNLVGYGTVYPDFTFLSRKLQREIYWEHEGMMDKPEYAINAVKKLNSYQMNGIMPGEHLILTFETEQDVLNSNIVSELVERYLI